MSVIFPLALMLCPTPIPIADETPSALERDADGWSDLLDGAGPDLEGWTRVAIPPDAPLDEISQWSLDPASGLLTCDGDGGHEWLRWDIEQGDAVFHVEWRFVPVAEGPDRYNSGIYARNSDDGIIWHQAQVGGGSGGFLFGDSPVDGELTRINLRDPSTPSRVLLAGEWNTFELTAEGPRLTLWVNGAVTVEWDSCEVPNGFVGLEAEGYRIEFRKVLLKPL